MWREKFDRYCIAAGLVLSSLIGLLTISAAHTNEESIRRSQRDHDMIEAIWTTVQNGFGQRPSDFMPRNKAR